MMQKEDSVTKQKETEEKVAYRTRFITEWRSNKERLREARRKIERLEAVILDKERLCESPKRRHEREKQERAGESPGTSQDSDRKLHKRNTKRKRTDDNNS